MQTSTLTFALLARSWGRPLAGAMLLLAAGFGRASAQVSQSAYYSTGSNVTQVTQPSPQVAGSGAVVLSGNAADGDFATFATLQTDITATAGIPVGLRLKITGVAPGGYRAGVLLANATGLLSLRALGTVRLRTYLTGAVPELREEKIVRADLVRAALLATDRPTQLEFITSQSFDAVEIVIDGLVSVPYKTNIYYAYGVRPGLQTIATGYLSQFASAATQYSTASLTGGICLNTNVDSPENAADAVLTNFSAFQSLLTVACQPSLRVKLANVPATGVPAGYYAGFVIGQAGILDVGVLSGLRLRTYRNGVQAESFAGAGVLELTLLPDGKAQVSFPSTKPFDEVSIERTGLITAVDNLQLYYGFGLAPAAFQGLNPLLSNFSAPTSPAQYSASLPFTIGGNLLLGIPSITLSSVSNPAAAADDNLNNFAQLNTTGLGLLGTATASLKLRLNGEGRAGNRVGMVVGNGAGLLDLAALQRLTLLTYDTDNKLVETKSGSDLLGVSLLGGTSDRNKISFLATRDFSYVELEVSSAASLLSNTRVYYAFAEDVPLLSVQTPLPVELTAFGGRWHNGAAELSWTTASEKNSSHFVVERASGGDADFQAVGQVAAAGASTARRSYQLRDPAAASAGAPVLYYRLRQADKDGTEAFSPVVAVAVSKAAAGLRFEVYPNPATDARTVRVRCTNLPATGGTVAVYSELGQLVSQVAVAAGEPGPVLPALTPGLYHLVLRDAAGQAMATSRLVVSGQ